VPTTRQRNSADRRSIGTRPPGPATASTTPRHGRQISAKACQPVALRVRPRPGMARQRSSHPNRPGGGTRRYSQLRLARASPRCRLTRCLGSSPRPCAPPSAFAGFRFPPRLSF
jgi:hypothetical protein